jgi:hypothetical protein
MQWLLSTTAVANAYSTKVAVHVDPISNIPYKV